MIEVNVAGVGHARGPVAVDCSVLDLRQDSLLQPVAHGSHLLVVAAVERFLSNLRSLAQTDNSRNIFRTRAPRTLVPPAIKQWLQPKSLADAQRPHALRPMNLVPRNRKRITTNAFHINLNFACSLHRIGMKAN